MSRLEWSIVIIIVIAGAIASASYVSYKNNQPNSLVGSSSHTESGSSNSGKKLSSPNGKDANGCYTPATVRDHYGENDCVDFTVGYTYETSAGTKFIDEKQDYQDGFVVYIPYNSAFSSVDLSQFEGKQIKASGLIKKYNGYPEIEADDYSQVSIY